MKFNILTMLFIIFVGFGLGLIISKIETKLSWKELITVKYKVLILAPILSFVYNSISRTKNKLGKLYKLRNKLQKQLFK